MHDVRAGSPAPTASSTAADPADRAAERWEHEPSGERYPQWAFPSSDRAGREARVGVVYGIAAFSWWGLVAVYFKAVAQVPALEVLAHRVFFSTLLLWFLLIVRGRCRESAWFWPPSVSPSCRFTLGEIPTVALILPATFGLYGLIRKVVHLDALIGLAAERWLRNGTDPLDADSDDDGLSDLEEARLGTDPTDSDSDDDGVPDGDDAQPSDG